MKHITISLQPDIHYRFMNKCKFFEISMTDVLTELIERYNNGEFDTIFDFPEDAFLSYEKQVKKIGEDKVWG